MEKLKKYYFEIGLAIFYMIGLVFNAMGYEDIGTVMYLCALCTLIVKLILNPKIREGIMFYLKHWAVWQKMLACLIFALDFYLLGTVNLVGNILYMLTFFAINYFVCVLFLRCDNNV